LKLAAARLKLHATGFTQITVPPSFRDMELTICSLQPEALFLNNRSPPFLPLSKFLLLFQHPFFLEGAMMRLYLVQGFSKQKNNEKLRDKD
jgi:hypothetical protein